MKVFVAGASGRVGQELVERLTARGNTVVAGCRNPQAVAWTKQVDAVEFDLHGDVPYMTELLAGCNAVYFVAGSRGKDLLQTDAFGAVKLMKAAKEAGAQRFIMLSSIFALQPQKWTEEPSLANIMNYNIAKFFADDWLTTQSGLEWTIVQPSALTEEPALGTVEISPEHDGSNPIPDVAEVLADVLERPNTVGKVIMLRSGDEPIPEALSRV